MAGSLSGFPTLLFFPANAGKLDGAGNGASTGTIGAYGTNRDAKLSTGSLERETIANTPNGETIRRRLGILVEHVSEKGVSTNLDVEPRPFSFPSVFTHYGT